MSRRKILVGVLMFCAILAGVSFTVWRKVNTRSNSPEFKQQVEAQISEATGGKAQIGSLSAHLSFWPWISARDVSVDLPDQRVQAKAEFLRFDLEILPLFRDKIVFSSVIVDRARLTIRRPRGGFPRQEANSSQRPRPRSFD